MAQTVQILRTTTNTPPATLLPGALSVELGTDTKLWVGSGGGNRLLLSSNPADTSAAGGAFLKLLGGTMTGPIVLPGNPTLALQAAPKQYVDAGDATLAAADTTIRNTYLPLAGGTLTGPLALAADPAAALQAATKQYVDGRAGATVAAVAPAAVPGSLWWDSNGGQMYVRYDDGNSQQWVVANSIAGLANMATKTDVAAVQNNVGRNYVMNSQFNIAQRGAGPFTVNNQYALDRWVPSYVLDTISITQAAQNDTTRAQIGDEAAGWVLANTFSGNAGATAYSRIIQRIEDVRRLAGKTVTVSFWAAAGVGGLKLGIGIVQTFGTGGSPSAAIVINGQAVTLSTNYARYSVTFALPSAAGKTLGTNADSATELSFWYSSGASQAITAGNPGVQSGAVGLWGVQLEIGSVATPLEKLDPQQDLAKCQRFYQTGMMNRADYAPVAGTIVQLSAPLPVTMRATPTITTTGTVLTNITGFAMGAFSSATINMAGTATAALAYTLQSGYTASADL